MKTWLNSKTGQRLPANGSISRCELVTRGAKANKRVEVWVQGEGRRTESSANWQEEEIPEITKNFTVGQYRTYVAAYGPHCAMEQIYTCDYMKPRSHRELMNPALPCDGDLAWFEAVFGASYRAFTMPIAAAFGVVLFDIVSFEKHLVRKFGYPAHLGTLSMADFMKQRFGEEALDRFRRIAIDA